MDRKRREFTPKKETNLEHFKRHCLQLSSESDEPDDEVLFIKYVKNTGNEDAGLLASLEKKVSIKTEQHTNKPSCMRFLFDDNVELVEGSETDSTFIENEQETVSFYKGNRALPVYCTGPPSVQNILKICVQEDFCSTCVHLCSFVFHLCSLVFTCVHLCSICVHLCSTCVPFVWCFRSDPKTVPAKRNATIELRRKLPFAISESMATPNHTNNEVSIVIQREQQHTTNKCISFEIMTPKLTGRGWTSHNQLAKL